MTSPTRAASARTPRTAGRAARAPRSILLLPSFADLGVAPELVASLASGGITAPFPIQAATLSGLAGRAATCSAADAPAAARPSPSRSRSSRRWPGVVHRLAAHAGSCSSPPASSPSRSTRPSLRWPRPWACAPARSSAGSARTRRSRRWPRAWTSSSPPPGRLADLIKQGHASLGPSRSPSSTRPTTWPTWASCPRFAACSTRLPATANACSSPRRWTPGWTSWRGATCTTRSPTRSIRPRRRSPRWTTTSSTSIAAERGEIVTQLVGGHGRTLAFARTKHQAKRWARILTASGIHAVDLHGNLSQSARQRNLAAFSDGDVRVLVATDIAARGIHVDDITLVVHIDPPAEHKAYLHRSGRTARAGAAGVVVTVATHDQRRDVADLMRRAAIRPTQSHVRVGDQLISDIAGPSAPRVVVANAQPVPAERTGRGSGSGSGRGSGRGSGGGRAAVAAGRREVGRARPARRFNPLRWFLGGSSGSRSGGRPAAASPAPPARSSSSGGRPASSGSTQVWSSAAAVQRPPARRGPRRATRPAGGSGSSS